MKCFILNIHLGIAQTSQSLNRSKDEHSSVEIAVVLHKDNVLYSSFACQIDYSQYGIIDT